MPTQAKPKIAIRILKIIFIIIFTIIMIFIGCVFILFLHIKSARNVYTTKLSNGLTVRILKSDEPSATLYMRYNTRLSNNFLNKSGMAHLTEHLAFYQGENTSKITIQNEASTHFDNTTYKTVFKPSDLESVLKSEAKRMTKPMFSDKRLAIEKNIIENEIAIMRSTPYNYFHWKFQQYLETSFWELIHLTNNADLKNITANDLAAFHKKYYTPSNAVLLIVGNLDRNKALDAIKKYFAQIPSGSQPELKDKQDNIAFKKGTFHAKHKNPDNIIFMAFNRPSKSDKHFAAYLIAMEMIDTYLTRLTYTSHGEISNVIFHNNTPYTTIISMRIASPKLCSAYEKKLNVFFNNLPENGPTNKEINFMKKYLSNCPYDVDELLSKDIKKPKKSSTRFSKVKENDVIKMLKKYFNIENASIFIVEGQGIPEKPLIRKITPVLQKTSFPAKAASSAEDVSFFQTKNGINVAVINNKKQNDYVIKGRISNAGSLMDGYSKRGCALLTGVLLRNGTKKSDTFIPEFVMHNDASLEQHVKQESIDFEIQSDTPDILFNLLEEYVRDFSFKPDDFKVEQNSVASLALMGGLVREQASREFAQILYKGAISDQYSSADYYSFVSLKPEETKSFYKNCVMPSNLFIGISGNLTPEEAMKALDTHLGRWKNPPVRWKNIRPAYNHTRVSKKVIKLPASYVGYIIKGMEAPAFESYDFPAFEALCEVLYARLQTNRNINGMWYDCNVLSGPYGWQAFVSAKPDKIVETEKLLEAEIKKLTSTGVTEAEAQYAANKLKNQYDLLLASEDGKMEIIRNFYGTNVDPFKRISSYSTLHRENLNKAAKKYIKEEKLITVIAEPQEKY